MKKEMNKLKVFGLSALTFFSSLNIFAQAGYHKKCNGSIAWLSSTTETRGASNPSATISPSGKYYGINQLDGFNVNRLIKYINEHEEYKSLQGKLRVNISKDKSGQTIYRVDQAKWKNLASTHPELFSQAQEDFLCAVYLPECFRRLQKDLITEAKKSGRQPIEITKLHPTILSLFARSFVKKPASTAPLTALKNARTVEAANTERFIINYTGSNEYLRNKALSSFQSKEISWKQAQISAACHLAEKEIQKYRTAKAQSRQKLQSMLNEIAPLRQVRSVAVSQRSNRSSKAKNIQLTQRENNVSRG